MILDTADWVERVVHEFHERETKQGHKWFRIKFFCGVLISVYGLLWFIV
jgi:hypothetical protein